MLEKALFGAVVACASEAGEIEEHGDFSCGRLRGQEEVEGHSALGGCGIVGQFEELASKGNDCCCDCEGHFRR